MIPEWVQKNKRWIIPATPIIAILWLLGLSLFFYETQDQQPLREAMLPPETKEFLLRLSRHIPDLQFVKRDGSGKEWTNRRDDAEASNKGFQRLESDNFIVYFKSGNQERADQILYYAEQSNQRLLEVFGHFVYAKDKGGRKLPMYLASTHAEYEQLSNIQIPSVACVKASLYDDAMIATAYVSPKAFSLGQEYTQQVVLHELAHYTHFDLANPKNLHNFRVWLTEGVACYTAREEYRLPEVERQFNSNQLIPLTTLNSYDNNYAYRSSSLSLIYATGLSVLQMIEQRFGRMKLTSFIHTTSKKSDIRTAVQLDLGTDLEELNEMWFDYLRSIYARQSSSMMTDPRDCYERNRNFFMQMRTPDERKFLQ
jgi:hypothetical protein